MKKTILSLAGAAALCGAVAAPAFAASTFHLVVPLNARAPTPGPGTETPPPVPEIAVSLAGAALPSATWSTAYSESLRSYLSVTGDAAFDAAAATWSLVSGSLPAGLTLDSATGMLTGTPTATTTSPAAFTVKATYKGKNGQADYSVEVKLNLTVSLAGAALPAATVNQAYSQSLKDYLAITGDPAPDKTAARWSLAGGALPAGLALDNVTGQVAGTPSGLNEASASFDVAVTYKDKSARQTYTVRVGAFSGGCKAYLQANPGAPSGWYILDVDGAGPAPAQSYYCDMTSAGGGWTRIVRQTEAKPVTNWTGGVNGDSYVLAANAIPAHTQVAFGKDENATFVTYVTWQYTTGEIAPVAVSNPATGAQYLIHRYKNTYYANHDSRDTYRDATGASNGTWANTLSIVAASSPVGVNSTGWAYSPLNETAYLRGFRMQTGVWTVPDTYAWTLWVR